MRIPGIRSVGRAALLVPALASASLAQAPERPLRSAPVRDLRFEVMLGATQALLQVIDVTGTLRVEGRDPVLLSMPAWTPGAYEIADHARQVVGFEATQDGREVRWDKLDPDTWRIVPSARGAVTIRYQVRADTLDNARAWTREDFAFFNGTAVFLYAEGLPELPAHVTVRTEAGWRVVSGMAPAAPVALPVAGSAPAVGTSAGFAARDAHDLMDHPFFVGRFDLDSSEVAGRWMRLATYPEGSVAGARRATMWDAFRRAVPPLVHVFGALPWSRYTVLQVADSAFPGMGALEHAESELAIVGTPYLDEPFVRAVHAHEFVHAWNVKRLRPADLMPYRYDRPQPTTWLWMSEGITDYYADLALVRSGLTDEAAFLATVLGKHDHVMNVPTVALEDASLQAWIAPADGTADIYYDKGSLVGLGLDLLIRDASDGARSLDDVMRELWDGPARAGRGFTPDEFWNAVTRAAGGRAFGQFAQRYIDGRAPLPLAEWLALGGWRIVEDSITEPRLGALLRPDPLGVRVAELDAMGAAARAGLEVGDVITAIGGRSTLDPAFGEAWREFWGKRPGAVMTLDVRRNTNVLRVDVVVEVTTLIDRHIAPDATAPERARRVRAGLLRGEPRPAGAPPPTRD